MTDTCFTTLKQLGGVWDWTRGRYETEVALDAMKRYLGVWYKWGGSDPSAFDCSGLACEYLKSLGIMGRRTDATAQHLADVLPTHLSSKFNPGDLVFFGPNKRNIVHVEICLTRYMTIGASGGGSKTLTVADAIRDGAFVKVRPIVGGRGANPVQSFGNVQEALLKVFASGAPLI
jgi:hypothetical protein